MNSRTFLSLPLRPWSYSAAVHLFFFLAVVLMGRKNTADLNFIDLDLAPASKFSMGSAQPPPAQEEWKIPQPLKRVLPPIPPQTPVKPEPVALAAPAAPATAGNASGEGNVEFRSLAQVGQGPKFIKQVTPPYPDAARRADIEGFVILQVDIDATGAVKKVELVQGLGYGCDEAALAAAEQSTFSPAVDKDGPVAVKMPLKYHFQFKDK